jgi:hypothetical protein
MKHDAISLDLPGHTLALAPARLETLRDAAAAEAGRSSSARDLSLLLDRALREGRLTLRRAEVDVLRAVAERAGLAELAALLAR